MYSKPQIKTASVNAQSGGIVTYCSPCRGKCNSNQIN